MITWLQAACIAFVSGGITWLVLAKRQGQDNARAYGGAIITGLILFGLVMSPKWLLSTDTAQAEQAAIAGFDDASVAYKFSVAHVEHMLPADDPSVGKAEKLLNEAALKFNMTDLEVASKIILARKFGAENNVDIDIFQLLEATPVMEVKETSTADDFNDLVAFYVTFRSANDVNHSQAIANIRAINIAAHQAAGLY